MGGGSLKKIDSSGKNNQIGSRFSGRTNYLVMVAVVLSCGVLGLATGRMLGKKPMPQTAPGTTGLTKTQSAPTMEPPMGTATKEPTKETITAPGGGKPRVMKPVEEQRQSAKNPTPVASTKSATPLKINNAPLQEEKHQYGKSRLGSPLMAYVLGNGPDKTMIFGAFHGNEPITDDIVLMLRQYLKTNPQILQGRCVILAPVVNPDGLRRGKRSNARGVDLNRNFPGTWRAQATKARYNPGPSAASEPETKAVIKLIEQYDPRKIVSLHQPFGNMNYTGEPGRRLALAMQKKNRYPITPDIGYPTPGSFGNYCGKTLRVAIVTHELRPESAAAAWRANSQALVAAIQH